MALEQEGFRWRNDDGSETTATWADSQDTNISLALDTPVRLRFAIDVNTGPSGAAKYRLEYKKSTDSQWIGIMPSGTAGHAVTLALSSNITAGGEATTAQLTAPSGKTTGDFATGRMWDDENGEDETADIAASDYTEFEWCVQAVSGVASASDIYQFRVTRELTAAAAAVTWDPANKQADYVTLSGSDLVATFQDSVNGYKLSGVRATAACSGKCFFRVVLTDVTATDPKVGIGIIAGTDYGGTDSNFPTAYSSVATGAGSTDLAELYLNNSYAADGIASCGQGDTVDVAVDLVNEKIWVRLNGTGNWNASGSDDPATNTGGVTLTTGQTWYPYAGCYSGDTGDEVVLTAIFADDSSGAAPSGFSWIDS